MNLYDTKIKRLKWDDHILRISKEQWLKTTPKYWPIEKRKRGLTNKRGRRRV